MRLNKLIEVNERIRKAKDNLAMAYLTLDSLDGFGNNMDSLKKTVEDLRLQIDEIDGCIFNG